ncbi:MAG: hypothetical protein A4E72_02039 [Syntrophus sp. PtaU1.Bin208]|nr:MAG: hypothetical protein A4E72_02039 [Syntrophus sp. PtaU1.Bin208]
MGQERPVDPHGSRHPIQRRNLRLGLETPEGQRGVLLDSIQGLRIHGQAITEIIPAVAGASKGINLVFDPDSGNFALPVAMFFPPVADKGGFVGDLPVFQGTEIKGPFLEQPMIQAFSYLHGHAEGPHQSGFRGDNDPFARQGGHGDGNGPVVTDPALHEDVVPHRAVSLYPVAVVHADGINESRDDVCPAHPFVGGILDIAVDEGGALVAEIGGGITLQGNSSDILHGDAHGLPGCFFEKRTRSGAAGVIHGVVGGNAVFYIGVFGILPPDFKDRVHR